MTRWIATCAECGRLVARRGWLRRDPRAGRSVSVVGTGCQGDLGYCIDNPCPKEPGCVATETRMVHDDCGVARAYGAPTPEELKRDRELDAFVDDHMTGAV